MFIVTDLVSLNVISHFLMEGVHIRLCCLRCLDEKQRFQTPNMTFRLDIKGWSKIFCDSKAEILVMIRFFLIPQPNFTLTDPILVFLLYTSSNFILYVFIQQ